MRHQIYQRRRQILQKLRNPTTAKLKWRPPAICSCVLFHCASCVCVCVWMITIKLSARVQVKICHKYMLLLLKSPFDPPSLSLTRKPLMNVIDPAMFSFGVQFGSAEFDSSKWTNTDAPAIRTQFALLVSSKYFHSNESLGLMEQTPSDSQNKWFYLSVFYHESRRTILEAWTWTSNKSFSITPKWRIQRLIIFVDKWKFLFFVWSQYGKSSSESGRLWRIEWQ